MKQIAIPYRALRCFPVLLAMALLLGTTGCSNTGSSCSSRSTTDEVYDSESNGGDQSVSGQNNDEETTASARTSRDRPLTQRQREHRRSMQNMGAWFISALIAFGINILLAVLIWG